MLRQQSSQRNSNQTSRRRQQTRSPHALHLRIQKRRRPLCHPLHRRHSKGHISPKIRTRRQPPHQRNQKVRKCTTTLSRPQPTNRTSRAQRKTHHLHLPSRPSTRTRQGPKMPKRSRQHSQRIQYPLNHVPKYQLSHYLPQIHRRPRKPSLRPTSRTSQGPQLTNQTMLRHLPHRPRRTRPIHKHISMRLPQHIHPNTDRKYR